MVDKGKARNLVVRDLVVRDLNAYNIILGQPTLTATKVVIVPHLMLIKFECNDGSVGTLHGDQGLARKRYYTAMKSTAPSPAGPAIEEKRKYPEVKHEVLTIATTEAERPQPVNSEFEEVVLDEARADRTLKLGYIPDEGVRLQIR